MTKKEKIALDNILTRLYWIKYDSKNLTQQQYIFIDDSLEEIEKMLEEK